MGAGGGGEGGSQVRLAGPPLERVDRRRVRRELRAESGAYCNTKETRASEKKDALRRPRAERGAVVRSERFVEPRDLWTLFTARGVKRRCSQLASNRAAYAPLSQRGQPLSCVDCGPPTC